GAHFNSWSVNHLVVSCFFRRSGVSCPEVLDRPDLDAAQTCRWHLRCDPDGLVQVARLDQDVAPKLFLRFHERAVGDMGLAVADTARGRGTHVFEGAGRDIMAVVPELLVVGQRLLHQRAVFTLGEGGKALLVVVDQAEIFHSCSRAEAPATRSSFGRPLSSITGRISTVPVRAPGIRSAIAIASSRSSASTR